MGVAAPGALGCAWRKADVYGVEEKSSAREEAKSGQDRRGSGGEQPFHK